MDRWGNHSLQRRFGRGISAMHLQSSIRDLLYGLGRGLDLAMVWEPHFPVRVPGAEERWPDLLFRN